MRGDPEPHPESQPLPRMSERNENEQVWSWIRADAGRPYCTLPWRQITVLSDGTAVCACVDAEKSNPLGDFTTQSFEEIWNGAAYQSLRRSIATDIDSVPICRGCPNRIEGPPPPADYEVGVVPPKVLFIESHAGCNLACPGCNREGIEGSRNTLALDFDVYRKLIDSVAPGLTYMEFHLGGENYMHKQANEMVRYCKDRNPGCFVLTSTNGHFFHTEERLHAVLDSGIDCVMFSIDGVTQEAYERYRVNGRLERVLEGMRRMVELKRERKQELPLIVWRYILFEWNDSDEEMDEARRLAREIGVDFLTWHLNAVDSQAASRKYFLGSPHLAEIRDELWDTLPERVGVSVESNFPRK